MPSKNQVLREAYQIQLEAFVEDELKGSIDYRTGEILDERSYIQTPYHHEPNPVPPCFWSVRSLPQLEQFWEHVDKRTLVTLNHTRRLYDYDKGQHHLSGTRIRFNETQLRRMDWLVNHLTYANALLISSKHFQRLQGLHQNNLHRWFRPLGGLVRVRGGRQGMQPGVLRVEVHPAYGYRYPSSDLNAARQQAIDAWCRELLQ